MNSFLYLQASVQCFKRPSDIATGNSSIFLSRTEGTIGEIAKLLTAAAVVAVGSGEECIDQRTLGLAAYQSPTKRRRVFERALLSFISMASASRTTRRRKPVILATKNRNDLRH